MEICVPYGRSFLTANIPDGIEVDFIKPPEVQAAADPVGTVRAPLGDLLGGLKWADFKNAASVGIAVNDKTRPRASPAAFAAINRASLCPRHSRLGHHLLCGRWHAPADDARRVPLDIAH